MAKIFDKVDFLKMLAKLGIYDIKLSIFNDWHTREMVQHPRPLVQMFFSR